MNIIRSDTDVILHDAFVALEESVDQYADSAEFLREHAVAKIFKELSAERLALLKSLAEAIRRTGNLPPAADDDKESFRLALQHVFASLSENAVVQVLEQCLQQERELKTTYKQLLTIESAQSESRLFKAIYKSHRFARLYLSLLCQQCRKAAV